MFQKMTMPIHTPIAQAEIIVRPYGDIRRLAVKEMGLRNHQLLFMTMGPRQHTSRHYHPQEEIYFILTGAVVFCTEEGEIEARAFDTIAFLANEGHQVFNRSGSDTCEILLAISPLYDPNQVTYLTS